MQSNGVSIISNLQLVDFSSAMFFGLLVAPATFQRNIWLNINRSKMTRVFTEGSEIPLEISFWMKVKDLDSKTSL